jgi:spermidine/putrescine transport system substrate-binding protein
MSRRRRERTGRIGRRRFLAGSAVWTAGTLSLGVSLPGCRSDAGGDASRAEEGPRLFFENWAAYVDPTVEGRLGSVDRFRQATGVDMRYTEAYNDNDEYFARIQPILGSGRSIEPDLIAPTNWLAARLIRLGWVDPLPLDQVPNRANLIPELRNPSWDPTGEYSLPWQSVLTGIAYNVEATGRELGSVADLLDPAFKGRVGMLTEMRDTIGLLLLGQGIDPSGVRSFEDAAPAFEELERAKRDGQIRAFTGADYQDELTTGNFAVCMAWSGDVLQLARDNPKVRFAIPEEGGLRATDTMVMPRGARNRSAAAQWADFVYDPAQAARITASVQFVSPVEGVQEELAKTDPELAQNPLLFPDAATRARLRHFANLDDAPEEEYDRAFSRIIGA